MRLRANNFDLIRLVLAIAVIFGHSFEIAANDSRADPFFRVFHTLMTGELAVCGFFILSGYLIAKSWIGDPTLGRFAAHRFLRIVPAFVAAFLISVLIVGPLGARDPSGYMAALSPFGLFRNLFTLCPPQTPEVFAGSHWPFVNGAVWTIHWEAICYLLTPGIIMLRGRKLFWVALFLGFICVILPDFAPSRFLLLFISGAAWAMAPRPSFRYWPMALLLLFAGMFVPGVETVAIAAFGSYLLLALGLAKPLLKPFPDISYGVFLYGWPVQMLALWWGVSNPWALSLVSVVAAAGFGYLSHRLIEAPALRLRPPRPAVVGV